MQKRFNERMRELFLSRNYFLSKRTDINEVIQFVQKLKPSYPQDRLIRIGAEYDGGYLIPDDLEGVEYCISPGVSDEASFEEEMLARGIKSYLCDYSVDGPPKSLEGCNFEKKFLGCKNDEVFHTMESWMSKHDLLESKNDLLLQMDIEGYEYPVLLSTKEEILRKFRIIIVEFHDLFNLFDPAMLRTIEQTFEKLLTDFHVAHIHPNGYGRSVVVNGHKFPRIIEITFIRKDRFSGDCGSISLPHPLDFSCIPEEKDMVLPEFWYR